MKNFDISMIPSMNLKELAEAKDMFQEMYQKVKESKTQEVIELKKSAFDILHKIVEISGCTDTVDEIVHQVKVIPISKEVEQVSKNEEAEQAEHSSRTEEPFQSVESKVEEPDQEANPIKNDEGGKAEEQLYSFADLLEVGHDSAVKSLINNTPLEIEPDEDPDDAADPYEYRDEEEYETLCKRAKKVQPMETLLSGEICPSISTLGYTKVMGTNSYKRDKRVINAEWAGGNTLTTQASPYVYIPRHPVSEAADNVSETDMKKCA